MGNVCRRVSFSVVRFATVVEFWVIFGAEADLLGGGSPPSVGWKYDWSLIG